MKILIFNTLYYPNIVGGAEKSVQLLAEGLIRKGHEVVIICTEKNKIDRIDWVNGVKVYYLKPRNLYWSKDSNKKNRFLKPIWHAIDIFNPFFAKVITKIIKSEKPDVIHTNNLSGFSIIPWIIAKKLGIPVVHTLRDYYLMCIKSTMYNHEKNCDNHQCAICFIYTYYKKILSNRNYVQQVVGNSSFIIDKHKNFGYFSNVPFKVIFTGTKINGYEKQEDKIIVPSKHLKFFYMGRIEKNKGVKQLLNEFQQIKNAELYLAGNIYDRDIQEDLDKNKYNNNIHFLGFINPKEIISAMDVVVVTSLLHDTLPRVILEAYQYQKPVIASNRGGIPEIVINGVTGYIFDPDIEGDLKEKINKIILNPGIIMEMSKNISKYVKNFDIETTIQKYIDVYSNIVNEAKKGK